MQKARSPVLISVCVLKPMLFDQDGKYELGFPNLASTLDAPSFESKS